MRYPDLPNGSLGKVSVDGTYWNTSFATQFSCREMGHQRFFPRKWLYLCWHWLRGLVFKDWVWNVTYLHTFIKFCVFISLIWAYTNIYSLGMLYATELYHNNICVHRSWYYYILKNSYLNMLAETLPYSSTSMLGTHPILDQRASPRFRGL